MGTLIYLIRQGFENVWKNKIMFIASVLIISTSMITLGIFTIIGENVKSLADSLIADQSIIAYVTEDLTDEQIEQVGKKILATNGVTEIKRETKAEAIANAREQLIGEEYADFTEGWEESNIFTDSFEVNVTDLEQAQSIADEIQLIEGVRKVRFDQEIFGKISSMSDIIKAIVLIIFVLLVAVSLLVISNTIKLVLHSRRREINIMKYIGATDFFVRSPFVIEGIIIGAIGAAVPLGIIYVIYNTVVEFVVERFEMLSALLNFLPVEEIFATLVPVSFGLGIGIGFLGSIMTVRKHLRV